jgi:hypothetical protein
MVKVLNQKLPGFGWGSFALAIQSIENLLTGMEDESVFILEQPGYYGKFEWHDGLTARKELEKCLSAGAQV